ncbi:MAG: VCBS repeat-containing protein [Acidobacteria bacterium]|nr:VCBS repeat-containing protein [Acidobacteriota bacterium]
MLLVEAHNAIPYSINWTNTNLITTDNVWSVNAELGVRGYSGADTPVVPGTNARTVLPESLILNVKANQTNPDALVEGGVAEFEIANPTIAIKGSDTARAPYINVLVDTTGFSNIRFRANVRDLSTVNNAVQQVAVQYRISEDETGPYTDVPSAYIADATEAGTATKVTPIDVILPAEANNADPLEIRVMTVNAVGNDEWIGIDDIIVTGITSTPRRVFDFDGDGRSDVSVFRPSNGGWYLLNSATGFASVQFGISTDKIVPADYDGDGKTDVAVYRSGTWYLNRSLAGFTAVGFGTADDIPQPADFNNDGRAELAVFRPSNGTWYVLNLLTNQFSFVQFGQNGDKPVVADYDGDGRADYAVYRNGGWYILRSSLGFIGIQFGEAADRPVPVDYDGDGKADVAVFRPSNGTWYLNRSTAGFAGIQFGITTDVPAPADYDGDGKADLAVFRDGAWYIQRSTEGFTGVQFGAANDIPVPSAFIPYPTPVATPTPTPTPTIFSGRATSVNATINGTNAILNDTGDLPANGGIITRSLMSGNVLNGALTTGLLEAVTQGAFDQSRSQAQIENLNLTVGGNVFTSDLVPASSQCTCFESGPPTCDGGVLIANLRINGVFIPIVGVNQTVNLPTGGTVVINEQIRTFSGNSAVGLTVNGVHIRIPTLNPGTPPIADIILSSAHSDINCGTFQ